MRIGEIAQRMECRTSAIRYYEKMGLLPAPQRTGGRRVYDAAVLSRLAVIEYARRAGFSLRDIRQLFTGFPPRATAGRRWQTLAQKKLAEIEASLAALKEMERLVRNSIRCQCVDLEECGGRILISNEKPRITRIRT